MPGLASPSWTLCKTIIILLSSVFYFVIAIHLASVFEVNIKDNKGNLAFRNLNLLLFVASKQLSLSQPFSFSWQFFLCETTAAIFQAIYKDIKCQFSKLYAECVTFRFEHWNICILLCWTMSCVLHLCHIKRSLWLCHTSIFFVGGFLIDAWMSVLWGHKMTALTSLNVDVTLLAHTVSTCRKSTRPRWSTDRKSVV